jgi:DNA-binding transcriptional regulator LsrR (DeoR family)
MFSTAFGFVNQICKAMHICAQLFANDGDIVGVSYGRAVASAIAALAPHRRVRVTAVSIIGALGVENTDIDGTELVRQFVFTYGGDYRWIPRPLLVEDEHTCTKPLQLPRIADTLALARQARWTLIGIGGLSHASLIWRGYLDIHTLSRLQAKGAVGHICGQFFDAKGGILKVGENRRTIGIGLKHCGKCKVLLPSRPEKTR